MAETRNRLATNLTSAVVKTPKVYWIDLGLWRHLTRYQGPVTGQMFENLVVTEVHKWIQSAGRQADLSFYRTRSGMEVDLLIGTPHGIWALEAKTARRLRGGDRRGLRALGEALGDRWRGGLVVYGGNRLERLEKNLWTVPVTRLLV